LWFSSSIGIKIGLKVVYNQLNDSIKTCVYPASPDGKPITVTGIHLSYFNCWSKKSSQKLVQDNVFMTLRYLYEFTVHPTSPKKKVAASFQHL
jgi:hypothetical protein